MNLCTLLHIGCILGSNQAALGTNKCMPIDALHIFRITVGKRERLQFTKRPVRWSIVRFYTRVVIVVVRFLCALGLRLVWGSMCVCVCVCVFVSVCGVCVCVGRVAGIIFRTRWFSEMPMMT